MLSLLALCLLTSQAKADPSFDARIKQLSLDRREAHLLCAYLNGKFIYYSEVGLGDPQFSVIYFPAGRADRLFISSDEGGGQKGKNFAASYEISNGRARRLWALDNPLTLKGGRFTPGQRAKRPSPALSADLAHPWALASYLSPDLMGNSTRLFDDERGIHSEDRFNTPEPYPVTAAERAWLRKHGFPEANNVREPASEMRKWEALAHRLQNERQRLAEACSNPTDKDLSALPSYYFPIGRSDSVTVVRPISEAVREVSSYQWENGTPRLRWQFRMRAGGPIEEKYEALIMGRPTPRTVSKAISHDLRSPAGFAEYIGTKEIYMGRIVGATGVIADYSQEPTTRPFETKDDEITYLRANRPWPAAHRN